MDETTSPLPAGWGWPALSRKAHYFDAGTTVCLCGKWMYSGGREPYTPGNFGPDDCAACKKKLEARAKRGA